MESATSPRSGDGVAAVEGYPDGDRPLAGYAVLTTLFFVLWGVALALVRRSGTALPESFRPGDVVTAGIATQRVSRHIAKDKSTSFVRAPFTRYEGRSGEGEVSEVARGRGLRRAIGELLICPYCLGMWVAAALAIGLVKFPRLTRLVSIVFAVETVADFLQLAYGSAQERS